jgi:outer membrane cobalamin receptor
MPDIQSALQAALAQTANAWAADDEAHQQIKPQQESEMKPEKVYFSVTNNVCRTTFDFVRDNPGMTRVEIAKELEREGFKSKSVSSLLGQMLRQGLVYANGKLLYTNSNEYTPIKSSKVLRARAQDPSTRKKVTIVNTRTGEVVNPKPAGIAALPTAPVEKPWEPSDVIDKLTVRQALALFKELRNILVG